MALNIENDPLMCKCFPISLSGPALNWFKNLPRGSVDSFRSLCDRFISQYYGNKRPAKDISSLFTMKQYEDECLQAFLTRFNLTKSMVIECHPFTVVQAFKLAMNRGTPFHASLVVNTLKTMDELNERADGFVCLEEEEAANARKTSIISTEEETKAKIRQKHAPPQRQTSWKAEKRPREEELITLLKVTLELKEAGGDADSKRRICGIYSRAGGEADRLVAQIKFDRTDLLHIQTPHEDPLVVSLTVAESLACRVLIDPGSSANIMPRITFDRLEIKPEKLKPTRNPLLGFDGKWVDPIGMVEVTVQATERVLTESFVVIEIHPSYNLLMGRGWIHRVQGVPSTLHQVMRCLGPDRTKKQRRFAPERNQIIAEEIDRLLDAGFIREVQYPDWLSNVIVMQKKNGKW
ncbi:uncharacterized protein LOC132277862 [Cornus florida]|uniref:uncharacterized protein LOC132277862 n=1 Tax=Cornus florida TaxID=4283 RepID=UPI002898B622|nr:uncharacterized protein LOC132277862 [Cornus florida]